MSQSTLVNSKCKQQSPFNATRKGQVYFFYKTATKIQISTWRRISIDTLYIWRIKVCKKIGFNAGSFVLHIWTYLKGFHVPSCCSPFIDWFDLLSQVLPICIGFWWGRSCTLISCQNSMHWILFYWKVCDPPLQGDGKYMTELISDKNLR